MAAGTWALWNVGLAGLLGAAGVALAAAAAHRTPDPSLATAALFLILHAGAAIALSGFAGGTTLPAAFLASASLMLVGVALFSGDVGARVMLDTRLFPMAAPTGGSLLILAWLLAGLSGLYGALKGAA